MTSMELYQLKEKAEQIQSIYTAAQLLQNKINQLNTLINKIESNEIDTLTIDNIEIRIDYHNKPGLLISLKEELNKQIKIFNEFNIERT